MHLKRGRILLLSDGHNETTSILSIDDDGEIPFSTLDHTSSIFISLLLFLTAVDINRPTYFADIKYFSVTCIHNIHSSEDIKA